MNAPRSRPPLRPQSRAPSASVLAPASELVGIDVALRLAAALRVYALEAIVLLDHEGSLLAAAGDDESGTRLTVFAAALALGGEDGARRELDGGRIVAELVQVRDVQFIVAVRGGLSRRFDEALAELRALLAPDAPDASETPSTPSVSALAPASLDELDDFAALDFDLTPVGPAGDSPFAADSCTAL